MSDDTKETSVPLAEISQGPNAFEAFLDRNQKGIIVLAILLVIGAVALVVYRGVETSRQESAGAALTKADEAADFQAVIDEHSETAAAGSAMVLLANSQWKDGKKDEAAATLRELLAEFPEHPAVPGAKASLASKLMAQGKSGDAAQIFEDLVDDPAADYIAPFALISLGDIAKAAGELEKAEASYSKVTREFPSSSFADTASRRTAMLKAVPPAEIEPPAAPPETTMPPADGSVVPPSLASPEESVVPTIEATEVEVPAEFSPQEDVPAPGSESSTEPPVAPEP